MTPHLLTRRSFLLRSSATALAANVGISSRIFGAGAAVPPSSRINLGFIGTGRQVFHANLPGFLWRTNTI